jgi:CheY-like chemotaxis protein/HPt (histidine-containing phosphotransfer) domain-containing protein
LVGLLGGRIAVESEPAQGSTFHFTVCLRRLHLQPDRAYVQAPAELHGLPVLIVDDNATSRRTLEEWLRGWRTEPTAVENGSGALDALQQATAAGRPFELIVLDSRLPATDALDLVAHIRQTPDLAASGILLLTVEDQPRELRQYHELGIKACVMKPVMEEGLLDAICRARSLPSPVIADKVTRWQGDKVTPEAVSNPVTVSPPHLVTLSASRRFHVLVAEDNPYNQALIEDLLVRWGHTLHLAGDGRAVLTALEHDHFDVMLLDIHMPEVDGFQVAAALRSREQVTGQHLPVIALTARSADGDRERCLQAGMDDYLAKPVRAADLFAAIERVVERMKAEGGRMEADTLTASSALVHPSSFILHPSEIDPATLLAACDGDAELLRKMCRHFQTFVPGRLAEVSDALRDRDAARLKELAHKLGGMVSSFSATAAKTAALLEQLGDQGKIEEAIQTHSRFTEIVGRILSALDILSVEQLRRQSADSQETPSDLQRPMSRFRWTY